MESLYDCRPRHMVITPKGLNTLRVQSAQSRTRSSEISFLRTVLVLLSTRIPYQMNIFFKIRKNAVSDETSEIAHFVCIV